MHIPAMDSIRHERVALVTDGPVTMVLQTHVQTEATDERGAEDPIEAMARPFPMMYTASEPTVLEPYVESGTLQEFSDTLVEYAGLLYESMKEGEWREEIEDYEQDDFASEKEWNVAHSLFTFAAREAPQNLYRTVYEEASKLMDEDRPEPDGVLMTHKLRDIEGRERYDFDYLPKPDDLDEWTITRARHDSYNEEMDAQIVSESLWLRYSKGDREEEIPLVMFGNEHSGVSAASKDVDYGHDMEPESVDTDIVRMVLGEDVTPDSETDLGDVSNQLGGTVTEQYLRAFVQRAE